jgi:hypothetical protein
MHIFNVIFIIKIIFANIIIKYSKNQDKYLDYEINSYNYDKFLLA